MKTHAARKILIAGSALALTGALTATYAAVTNGHDTAPNPKAAAGSVRAQRVDYDPGFAIAVKNKAAPDVRLCVYPGSNGTGTPTCTKTLKAEDTTGLLAPVDTGVQDVSVYAEKVSDPANGRVTTTIPLSGDHYVHIEEGQSSLQITSVAAKDY